MDKDRKRHLKWRLTTALIICAGFVVWKSFIWGIGLFVVLTLAVLLTDRYGD
jgi:hypothetical protein